MTAGDRRAIVKFPDPEQDYLMDDRKIRGVLVEDDLDDTLLLMDLMARSDWPSFKFSFVCAQDLKSGLETMAREVPEIALLDLMLPDSQGLETVRAVRAAFPDLPLVVLTGLNDETLGLEAVRCGAQDYQVKGSVSGRELKRTISYAVERHRSWASLRNIVDGSPDGMAILDGKGEVLYANSAAEAMLGKKKAELAGKRFPLPLPRGLYGEIGLPGQDGQARAAEVRLSEIEWQGSAARLALIRDITDLRRIEQLKAEVQERRRMDALKDELLGAVSHEMRNPLSIIKAATSSLREGAAGPLPKEQDELVQMQHRNVQRLEKIIENVLEMSRLESGRAKLSPRRVDAAALITESLAGFRLVAGEQNVLIRLDAAGGLPPVNADPELLLEVFGNLIDNALRFAKSEVWVRARPLRGPADLQGAAEILGVGPNAVLLTDEKFVQFSVEDDGPGVPPDRLGDLFNKFVQVARCSKGGSYKGTGLGLAICKEIVERLQGRIWAENGAGGGARFRFILPQFVEGTDAGK